MVFRFRAPASVLLRRAQVILMLATLVPTVLMLAVGIVLLAVGSGSFNVVAGVLTLAFCTTSLTGYILGSIFVSRGASLARVQNDFVSTVSHELRTPLTSIRMFIETLQSDRIRDPDEKRKCIELLRREVGRLEGLVDRVIELSRIETGRRALDFKSMKLAEVAEEAIQAFNASTLTDPTPVQTELDESVYVQGDRSALGLAVTNLLLNAWKYTEPGQRRISLKVSGTDREAELVVRDNGLGIPRDEQRMIFERFERGQAAVDQRKSGSGLGLAIVRAIMTAHRGRAEVKSKLGQGAEFKLRLRRERVE